MRITHEKRLIFANLISIIGIALLGVFTFLGHASLSGGELAYDVLTAVILTVITVIFLGLLTQARKANVYLEKWRMFEMLTLVGFVVFALYTGYQYGLGHFFAVNANKGCDSIGATGWLAIILINLLILFPYLMISRRLRQYGKDIVKNRNVKGEKSSARGRVRSKLTAGTEYVVTESNDMNDDEISACVYAPAEVRARRSFIVRVYMYRAEEQTEVDSKVREIDPKAVKKEYKPLDLPVKEGDKLTVQLSLSDGVLCKETSKSVIWKGHYTDCSFMAKLTDENQESIEGSAYIFVNDLPAGEMLFTIDVIETSPREIYAKVDAHRFSKIFISYAHQDEIQVRGIAEGCRMLGKDYFFDRHSLKAGDIFKEKIFNYINDADLFVLCWSKNAAESKWVKIEREHALELIRAGKSKMTIYPLSLRPEAPLPMDMSDKYNFGML